MVQSPTDLLGNFLRQSTDVSSQLQQARLILMAKKMIYIDTPREIMLFIENSNGTSVWSRNQKWLIGLGGQEPTRNGPNGIYLSNGSLQTKK